MPVVGFQYTMRKNVETVWWSDLRDGKPDDPHFKMPCGNRMVSHGGETVAIVTTTSSNDGPKQILARWESPEGTRFAWVPGVCLC